MEGACTKNFRTLGNMSLAIRRNSFCTLLKPGKTNGSAAVKIVDSLIGGASKQIGIFNCSVSARLIRTGRRVKLMPRRFGFGPFRAIRRVIVRRTNCCKISHSLTGRQTGGCLSRLSL